MVDFCNKNESMIINLNNTYKSFRDILSNNIFAIVVELMKFS
jgi:hypothetical protein